MLRLTFKESFRPGVDLDRPRTSIGRDASNHVVIDAPGVSGYHAEVLTEGDCLWIVDLGAGNPTLVNGEPLAGKRELRAWDELAFDIVEARITDSERRAPTVQHKVVVEAAPSAWMLRGETGACTGRSFSLGERTIAGRDEDCDIVLPVQEVSRRHAELCAGPDGVSVRDLGSTNGTFINGKRISSASAGDGDEIRFDVHGFRLCSR